MHLSKFEQFLKNRTILIDMFNKGDLSKEEFIEENYNYISSLGIKPFQIIDNVKKAVYNYQYYNVIAKYYQKKAHDLPKYHPARNDYLQLSQNFYDKKDRVTLALLKVIDFSGVEAYYVRVKSPNLNKKLFEIVLQDYDNVILHSISEKVLKKLIDENVFSNQIKDSIVDSYINKKY